MATTKRGLLGLVLNKPAKRDGFIQSRLAAHAERNYGTLPRGVDCAQLINRGNPLTA